MAAQRVCVYAGSQPGARARYSEVAGELVAALADRGLGAVYGGGRVGIMGELAEAALARGVEIIGVIPRHLQEREVAHHGLSELRITASMHERKAVMAELSDAFVALPGGLGTLEELVEMLTWAQLGLHNKPCGLVNVDGYYDELLAFLDTAMHEGFMAPANRALLHVEPDPAALIEVLLAG